MDNIMTHIQSPITTKRNIATIIYTRQTLALVPSYSYIP